jgi:mono/diheme cytochrome c family protein
MINRTLAILLPALAAAPAAEAWSPERGRLLYDNFCYHCHISEIHYRADTEIRTWAELIRAVTVWQTEMELGWSGEDIADVAGWLDRAYYGLADAPRAE